MERTSTLKEKRTHETRSSVGKTAALTGIACNILLAGGKLAAGRAACSMAIFADGLNNLSDAASSVVTLTGFKLAEKPADQEHPYGHARYEYLAGLTVAVMILFIGFELAKSSVEKILRPEAVAFSLLSMAILLISMGIKAGMMLLYNRTGKQINSSALLAAAQDSRNDILTTCAVILAALAEHFTGIRADGIMGLLVSLFILWSGLSLAKETISPLLGEGARPDLRRELMDYIDGFPSVLGCHDLMVHDYGPEHKYATIHIEFNKNDDLLTCHEIIDEIERECLRRYGLHLVIHLDPVITDNAEINRTRRLVEQSLAATDSRLTMHDFRMHSCQEQIKLVFDMVIPPELQGHEAELKSSLEQTLNHSPESAGGKHYQADITFDLEAEES